MSLSSSISSLRLTLLLGLAVIGLSACGSVSESLGLGRAPPDEFAVVDRPPLSMPPDFGLRPPKPGAPRPQEVDMKERASATLFGPSSKAQPVGAPDASDFSGGEKALLEASGADKANPDIRNTIDRETSQKVSGSEHLIDDLLFWRKTTPEGTVVNAPEEAERIRKAKEKGEAVNQGATPVIEKKKSGWLGL